VSRRPLIITAAAVEAWVGTCRELVLTLDNGRQYRAHSQFVEAE
jgi:hypothetical protein